MVRREALQQLRFRTVIFFVEVSLLICADELRVRLLNVGPVLRVPGLVLDASCPIDTRQGGSTVPGFHQADVRGADWNRSQSVIARAFWLYRSDYQGGNECPELAFTSPMSLALIVPLIATSARKLPAPTATPDCDFTKPTSPAFTLPLPFPAESPISTPIGTKTSPVLVPSLTFASVTPAAERLLPR